MAFRIVSIVAIAVWSIQGIASGSADETPTPYSSVSAVPANISAYRQYMKQQANALVGMTRVLATEIKAGNVEAAQSAYAPAHRYLERLAPIAKTLPVLHRRMNARADDYAGREADPGLSGFHRIEYGLFANHSTAGLIDYADRLSQDARELRTRVNIIAIAPDALVAEANTIVSAVAAKKLDGDEERYSRTDLWDLEANIDGVQEVVALLQPNLQSRDGTTRESKASSFSQINDLLAKQKDGCGFKNYDEVSRDDKAALKAEVTALAGELSKLRTVAATD